MSTVINTNLASLFAQNSLSNAQNNLATSVQRLSSGLRINSAKDDAAGLAISQNMQSQINGTNQSIQNLNNATNLLQTADSSLSTVQDMLLRMKQLSVQGYDGSLSNTQKADIVQQMSQLNDEINATASRTQFNGINLLSSGAGVDNVNSDIVSGAVISPVATPVTLDTTQGLGTQVTSDISDTGNFVTSQNVVSANTTATKVSVALDPSKSLSQPGTYTLTSNGSSLTLTGTINGVSASQTVQVGAASGLLASNGTTTVDQSLAFSNFGITINTHSVVDAGKVETATNLASALAKTGSIKIDGASATVQNVITNGASPGTYQLSQSAKGAVATVGAATVWNATNVFGTTTTITGGTYTVALGDAANAAASGATADITISTTGLITAFALDTGGQGYGAGDGLTIAAGAFGSTVAGTTSVATTLAAFVATETGNQLTMTGTVNGASVQQSLEVQASTNNSSQTLNFSSFGIQFDVASSQALTSTQIAQGLVGLNSGSNAVAGQFVIGQGNNSDLQFQSGATSAAFVDINTLNIQTGSSGATAGSNAAMMNIGSDMTALQNLVTAGSNATSAQWASAFQASAAHIDNATDYISTQRSTYGSEMNRLSFVSTNLTAQSTNLQNSRSEIVDTNFASETANLTKGQIMQQAATAMLAQANQMPNVILSLLK